jgi:ATP-dependent helicase Lhr and Lhr-like helicase
MTRSSSKARSPSIPHASLGDHWLAQQGMTPFAFQREVWAAMAQGASGLVHATTGSGKTYAVWLGALQRSLQLSKVKAEPAAKPTGTLQVLWLTPMRALASDSVKALRAPLADLTDRLPGWAVGQRTGDTPSAERQRQDKRMPQALVTTPESLTLMLTREQAQAQLGNVHTVVVDEWHEMLGNKRGVQVQLAIARLRRWNPQLIVWGMSATLGNTTEALHTLTADPHALLVRGRIDKAITIDTLIPDDPGRFTWVGHLGAQMHKPVIDALAQSGTTLVFTNVRSQAEIWYQLLLTERPEWAGEVALHHGSLSREVRDWVESALKAGQLRAVVATSSLDLGVDFLPVERVLQIGSAKGVARLLQRAGRSGHAPGRTSRITLVPTNALELVEAAAARNAAVAGDVESRSSPAAPLDVLTQHLVSMALGGGFDADAMYDEVRSAPAYASLTREAFDWALAFVSRGGTSLSAYPEYHRVQQDAQGRWHMPNPTLARRHRLQVGTIVSESMMQVKWLNGGSLGQVEESFVARLSPGDCFVFGGRVLAYVRTQEMTAYVQKGHKSRGIVPAWAGGRMPLSTEMARAVVALLHAAARGEFVEPEMQAVRPMLQAQAKMSRLPTPGKLLVEQHRSREGFHLFLYPFAGRNVHIGLSTLLAWRLSRDAPNTFSMAINDHGLELLAVQPIDVQALLDGSAWAHANLVDDVIQSLAAGRLAQRRFREIARIAGLVFGGFPGQPKSTKQLQASSSLFFEVFKQYDSDNLLLRQAHEEVLAQELELERLRATLAHLATLQPELVTLAAPSPFALPLMMERLREELSTEKLADRLQRILAQAHAVLDDASVPGAASPRPRRPARRPPPS